MGHCVLFSRFIHNPSCDPFLAEPFPPSTYLSGCTPACLPPCLPVIVCLPVCPSLSCCLPLSLPPRRESPPACLPPCRLPACLPVLQVLTDAALLKRQKKEIEGLRQQLEVREKQLAREADGCGSLIEMHFFELLCTALQCTAMTCTVLNGGFTAPSMCVFPRS